MENIQMENIKLFLQAVELGEFSSQLIESWESVNRLIAHANAKGYSFSIDEWYEGVAKLQSIKNPAEGVSDTPGIPRHLPHDETQLNIAALAGLKFIPVRLQKKPVGQASEQ